MTPAERDDRDTKDDRDARDERDHSERGALLATSGVLALGAVLYLGTLHLHGFWFDEIKTVLSVRHSFGDMVAERAGRGHPPLYFAITWLVHRMAGEGEVVLRLPSVLAGLASAGVLAALFFRAGHRWGGVAAALLLLSTRHQLEFSQMTRPYALAQLFVLLSTWVLAFPPARPLRAAAAFAAFSTAALYSHGSAGFALAGQIGFLLTRRPLPRHLLAGAAVAGLSMVPFLLLSESTPEAVERRLNWIHTHSPDFASLLTKSHGASTVGGEPVLVALLIGGGIGAWRLGRLGGALAAVWIGAPLCGLIATAVGGLEVTKIDRYFTASVAAQAGLLAGCVIAVADRARLAGFALLASLVVIGGLGLENSLRSGWHVSYREAAHHIQEHRRTDEWVVLLDTRYALDPKEFRFYFGDDFAFIDLESVPEIPPNATGIWVLVPHDDRKIEARERMLRGFREHFANEEATRIQDSPLIHLWNDAR